MNFDEAITAHAAWKLKLKNYIRNPDHSLNPDHVCRDDQCALGKWILSAGARYARSPHFQALRHQHAMFHRAAGEIVRCVNVGEKSKAVALLEERSAFSATSREVVTSIMQMKRIEAGA